MLMASRRDDVDPAGFDENRNHLAEFLAMVVPARLARWGVTIEVSTPRRRYELGSRVPFTVTIRNRLPVPVQLETPRLRLWGWAVDGEVEATDERVHTSDTRGELALDAREVRRIDRVWNGRLERTGVGPNGRSEWVLPAPGTHELSVFLATEPRVSDSVEITIRASATGSDRTTPVD